MIFALHQPRLRAFPDFKGKALGTRLALHTYIVPTRETKLWEETTTARTKGMPNNEGMRGSTTTRGGGEAKL